MKCEICHQADAETVLMREKNGEEEELYVCKGCAAAERKNRQKRSQRTRKVTGLPPGVSMSITEVSGIGENPPPIVSAIMDAFGDLVRHIEANEQGGDAPKKGDKSARKDEAPPPKDDDKPVAMPCARVPHAYRFAGGLHLEGLHLIGELQPVIRAVKALDLNLASADHDGVTFAGHVFLLGHHGTAELAKRVMREIIRQEENARERLRREMPRVFGDALCRALAILKNCRMLAPGELFDLLSPLRLAALDGLLDGITLREIESIAASIDFSPPDENVTNEELDRMDEERADKTNKRFEDVVLNERAEGMYLS